MKLIAVVIGDILFLENRVNRKLCNAVYSAEDGCDSTDFSAVIKDTFHSSCKSLSGCDGTIQDQYVFSCDHRLDVVAEDHLSHAVIFR